MKVNFPTSEWDTQIKNCWSIGLQRRREADNASEEWVVSCEDWKFVKIRNQKVKVVM